MTGFREEKSSMSWRVTEWNSKWDDRDALTTREQAEKARGRRGGGGCKEERNTVANAHTQRKHDASVHHGVMDGAHWLINQRRWKGRMLRRVFRATLPRTLGWWERRDVLGMREQMLTHIERRARRAWPNLAWLMKNGQESAYLACPSLHSTTAPPHFLLLLNPNLCIAHLYPPCPFHSLCLPSNSTHWSVFSPHNPPSSHKYRHPCTLQGQINTVFFPFTDTTQPYSFRLLSSFQYWSTLKNGLKWVFQVCPKTIFRRPYEH